jgi:hypothetical protein
MRLVARALAVVATSALIATGVATPAWAAGVVTPSPTHHFNDATSFALTLTTTGTYVPASSVNIKLTGPGADTKTVTGTVSAAHSISATLNMLDMNPGLYAIDVSIGAAPPTDQCAGCFRVDAYAPSATSVSPATFAEGTTGGGYNSFNITGQNFTHGPYAQCTALPCTGPSIAVLKTPTTFDTKVHLLDTTTSPTPPTETTIVKRINVDAGTDAAHDDDVVVYNSDGTSGTCAACLHVLPQPTISSVVLKRADSTTLPEIGANATHQTVVVTGHNLPADTKVSFVAPGSPPSTTAGTITFDHSTAPVTSGPDQAITVVDVDTTKVTTVADDWGVLLSSVSVQSTSAKTNFPVKPAPAPTALNYQAGANSTAGLRDYGQGAKNVTATVVGTSLVADTLTIPGTRVVFTGLPAGVTLKTQVSVNTGTGTVGVPMDIADSAATGQYHFHLVNPDGGTSPDCNNSVQLPPSADSCFLTIATGPTVTSVTPATVTGGFSGTVVIKGTGFHTVVGGVHVVIGPNNAASPQNYVNLNYTADSGTQITVTGVNVPAGETVQDVDVVVTNNDDQGTGTSSKAFHIANLSIDNANPSFATNDQSKSIKVNGTHLTAADTTVLWLVKAGQATIPGTSIANATPDIGSATALTASFDLTDVAPGLYDIKAVNTNGSNLGTAVCSGCFTVVAGAPTASGAAPSPVGGGAPDVAVVISGTNFFPGATVSFSNSHVHLIGTPTVGSGTITQHVSVDGSATANTGTVTVTNTDGQSVSTAFSTTPAPSVSTLTPTVKAAGTSFTMTVNGSGFSTSTAPTLSFDTAGVSASGYAVNPAGTSLTPPVRGPPTVSTGNPVTVHVTLVNSDKGQAVSPVSLTVNPQPVISGISTGRTDPSTAPAGSSVTLQVNGAHFASGVTLAPHDAGSGLSLTDFTRVDDTKITVKVAVDPSAAPGARTLDLVNPDGGATSTQLFVITPSSAPQALSPVGGVRGATITWGAPASDGGSAITSYTVTVTNADPNGTSPLPQTVHTTSDTVTGLANGASYNVAVIATNDAGHSPAVTGTFTTDTFPDAPSNLTLTGGLHQIDAAWDAPSSDGGSPVTSYTVKATNNANGADTHTSPAVSARSYTITGLANGAVYTVSVIATTLVGDSPATLGQATTADVPGAPTSVAATSGLRQLGVTWGAAVVPAGSPAVTSYRVTAVNAANAGDAHDSGLLGSASRSFTVSGLTDGATYVVSVFANNAAGQSAAAMITKSTFAVPGTPTNVVAEPGDRQVTVTFGAPATDGGTPITGYTVTATPGNVVRHVSSVSPVTYTGLANGTEYTFTVTATNIVGTSAAGSDFATPLGVSTISFGALPSKVVYGTGIVISGTLHRTDTSAPAAHVLLYGQADNGSVSLLASLTPSSTGAVSLTLHPGINRSYILIYPGDNKNDAAGSVVHRTLVAAKITRYAPTGSATTAQVITGTVYPNKAGKVVTLYRVTSTGSLVKLASAKLTSSSTYKFSVKLPKGYTSLKITIPATTNNAAGYVAFRAYRS